MQVFKQHGLKVFENKVLREICVNKGTGKNVLVHSKRVHRGNRGSTTFHLKLSA
jgi:hypothetical protein